MATKDKNGDIVEDIEKVRDALAQVAHDVKNKAESLVNNSINDAKSKTANLEETARDYMKEHPVKVIAFSVIAGMLISKILRK